MRKMLCCNFKRSSSTTPSVISREENVKSLVNNLNINDEYKKAFRTKSYIEMLNKVEGQLGRRSLNKLLSSSSLVHLSDTLLEPPQETLVDIVAGSNLHHLLIDYFESSLEACHICELLLRSVHQTRSNYQIIRRVIKLTKRLYDRRRENPKNDQYCDAIFGELSSFASLKNPLSVISIKKFRDVHDRNDFLLQRLTSKRRRVRRRAKMTRGLKKMIVGFGLVVSYSVIAILLLALTAGHGMVGLIAAPAVIGYSLCSLKKKSKMAGEIGHYFKTSFQERLGEQLEVAKKGVYILMNDFDTMSQLVRRLENEMEHSKEIAHMCVRNGKSEVLKEVVRELEIHEASFVEQLEELEEHLYLCFLTINRSRTLVIQEILMLQPENTSCMGQS
ncbi:UPF0496 protein At1g20180 [Cornus florida]|uniref:UPF0496 protein At1g20180 n=1 Tax=Cornus florida TaxID=4283 RepID=UPI00289C6F48|nr:UPF0496 protein At1g20180 [Cornus florida]